MELLPAIASYDDIWHHIVSFLQLRRPNPTPRYIALYLHVALKCKRYDIMFRWRLITPSTHIEIFKAYMQMAESECDDGIQWLKTINDDPSEKVIPYIVMHNNIKAFTYFMTHNDLNLTSIIALIIRYDNADFLRYLMDNDINVQGYVLNRNSSLSPNCAKLLSLEADASTLYSKFDPTIEPSANAQELMQELVSSRIRHTNINNLTDEDDSWINPQITEVIDTDDTRETLLRDCMQGVHKKDGQLYIDDEDETSLDSASDPDSRLRGNGDDNFDSDVNLAPQLDSNEIRREIMMSPPF